MDHFELHSEYQPTGDQPAAIAELVKGFREGNQAETLLGVTGSGKTFTMANVIQQLNKPTLLPVSHRRQRSSPRRKLRCGGRPQRGIRKNGLLRPYQR